MEIVREEMKLKSQGWVPHSDIPGSLEDAFHLWDAVSWPFDLTANKTEFLTKELGISGSEDSWQRSEKW